MKSVLLDFKTSKEDWFEKALQHYTKKISHYCDFEVLTLKTLRQGREELDRKKLFEEQELLKKINSDDFVILFDETGKSLTSEGFADQITKCETSGKKRICYIIGGAFGVTDKIKNRADLKLSLSSYVMNHLVAETDRKSVV